ncbi:growth-regulating factor 3 [Prosopis cineraria]|uniref:growth-regulating factor 3 n=1 Tax=Prosopis cineraria TaxID=364024 RepID=UPI00240F8AA8|nr:growth-regulating factor 3 [Prosopis cineraria]
MDFHLKQWKNQHEPESEERHCTKMPRLMLESHLHPPSPSPPALPLFVPELHTKVGSLSAFSDSSLSSARFPRMGSYFSVAQWQELELQALIFRYMLAGAAVPPELLLPIKKSLLRSAPYFLQYQPSLLQSGYWGGATMDPEPGRCRRTDGKKWRCSRDVVAGQKYCERHMHRGRNRSRKPVEVPTPATAGGVGSATAGGGVGCPPATTASVSAPHVTTSSLRSPFDLLQLKRCSSGTIKNEKEGMFENQSRDDVDCEGRSDGHILRHFFDDWPRSLQERDNAESNASTINSATCLSISMPGNASSDVSLKLSTGDDTEDPCSRSGNVGPQHLQLNWAGGWTSSANHVAPMGGPLAEVLRSSTTTSSPTSVLHQLPRGSASETSFIST